MNKNKILEALKKLKEQKKRNFEQQIDFIINFQELDLKKPENQLNFFVTLPFKPGKEKKVAGFVDVDLVEDAKKYLDFYLTPEQFQEYAKDKKKIKKLAEEYDFFIAQGNLMKDIAANFGRVLGSRGKMPDPKGGMIVPPKGGNLKDIVSRLRRTVRVRVRNTPNYQTRIGSESQKEEEVVENVNHLFEQIVSHLPSEVKNVKSVFLKTTMGKPERLM